MFYNTEVSYACIFVERCSDTLCVDLMENTPVESPSRGLVERALESATRIAAKCDRAQDNSAFFLRRA